MVTHVYALCWNEEKMLPYFFKHYDHIADQYFIYDNDSTDGSLAILKSHPKVDLRKFEVKGDSVVKSAQGLYNQCWKQSRGVADWVIIVNVDEHFYHPNLRGYLEKSKGEGVTLIVPKGYEMVADDFPTSNGPLYKTVKYGVRMGQMDKPQLFNPNEIEEINFTVGRHLAYPVGNVVKSTNTEMLLLHYKYLGFDYVNKRLSELRGGLRQNDINEKLGVQYLWDEKKKRQEFENLKKCAVKVL